MPLVAPVIMKVFPCRVLMVVVIGKWFFDKSRDFAIGICHRHPYGAFGNSQVKKEN
jgi:hypothetical protein